MPPFIARLARELANFGIRRAPSQTTPSQRTITTREQFERMREESNKTVQMVLFSADWCGHCRDLKPEWKAATGMGAVRWNVVNCNETSELVDQLRVEYNVEGFPTILRMRSGEADKYKGRRTRGGIRTFAAET